MIFKKILDFLDKSEQVSLKYGSLYKLKNETLPFRYVYVYGDDNKGIHRFKHHQLKEYIFYDLSQVEREANPEETRLYNIIKDYINEVARKENNSYYN
jgi:hypothetical protein